MSFRRCVNCKVGWPDHPRVYFCLCSECWVARRLRNARRALKIQARRIDYLESAVGFIAMRGKRDRLRAEIAELKLVGCAPADSGKSLALPKVQAVLGIRRVFGL